MSAFKISAQWAAEGKALVESGDINLAEQKERFLKLTGRATTLNDESLAIASMAEDDGLNDKQFIDAIDTIEAHGFEIIAKDEQEAAE